MDDYRNMDKAEIDELKRVLKKYIQKLRKNKLKLKQTREVITQFLNKKID